MKTKPARREKLAYIGVRLPKPLKEALEVEAQAQTRTLSSHIAHLLKTLCANAKP